MLLDFIFHQYLCIHADGPYGLTVNSEKGQKIGKVFTFDKGEAVQIYCSADSNPPNNYSWIQKSENSTHVITQGRYLEVASEKVTQKAEEYRCSAYNSMTGKRDETGVFVVIIPNGKNECVEVRLQSTYCLPQEVQGSISGCPSDIHLSSKQPHNGD